MKSDASDCDPAPKDVSEGSGRHQACALDPNGGEVLGRKSSASTDAVQQDRTLLDSNSNQEHQPSPEMQTRLSSDDTGAAEPWEIEIVSRLNRLWEGSNGARAEPSDACGRCFGDFEILDVLGRGGMGIVYRARQISLDRLVALKMMPLVASLSPEYSMRFKQEAATAARLDHSGIVPVFSTGEEDGVPWYTMAIISGQSLAKTIIEVHQLVCKDAAKLVLKICEALQYAHDSGVIHRDIKPSNILIDANGEPHLSDFGLAKLAAADSDLTRTGDILGTAAYMSPEQAAGKNTEIDARSDIYSVGALLYHCIVGRRPFQASSPIEVMRQVSDVVPVLPRQVNPEIDLDLETICMRCLEKDPAARFASASALVAELKRYLDGKPILSRPVSSHMRLWRWCRRRPYIAASLAMATMLFSVLAMGIPAAIVEKNKRAIAERDAEQAKEIAAQSRALAAKTQELAQATQARAANHRYFAAISDIREKSHTREPGWVVNSLRKFHSAIQLPADGKEPADARTLLASLLTSSDVTLCQTFAKGVDPDDIAISRDGRWLAMGDIRGTPPMVRLFRIEESEAGVVVRPCQQFSIGSGLWNLVDQAMAMRRGLRIGPEGVRSVCFSSDSRRLAVGTRHGRIIQWELSDDDESWNAEFQELRAAVMESEAQITKLRFMGQGQMLVGVIQKKRKICVWDSENGNEIWSSPSSTAVRGFTTLGDDLVLMGTDERRALIVKPSRDSSKQFSIPLNSRLRPWIASEKEWLIAASGESIQNRLYDIGEIDYCTELFLSKQEQKKTVSLTQFGPSGSTMIARLNPGEIHVWDALSGAQVCQIAVDDADRPLVAVNEFKNLMVVSGHSESRLFRIHSPTGLNDQAEGTLSTRPIVRTFSPGGWRIDAFDLQADGKRIAILESLSTGGEKYRVRVFDTQTSIECSRWTMRAESSSFTYELKTQGTDVEFRPNGNLVVAARVPGVLIEVGDDGFGPIADQAVSIKPAKPDQDSDGNVFYQQSSWRHQGTKGKHDLFACVTYRYLGNAFQKVPEIRAKVSHGDITRTHAWSAATFDPKNNGWQMQVVSRLPIDEDRIDDTKIELVVDQSEEIQWGEAWLMVLPTDTSTYWLGPVAIDGDCLWGIDGGERIARWVGSPLKKVFEWSDQANQSQSIRDVCVADSRVFVGMRFGHLFGLSDGEQPKMISGENRIVTGAETGKEISCVAVGGLGRVVVAGNRFGELIIHDLEHEDDVQRQVINAHRRAITAICISKDARLIATGANNGEIKIWRRDGEYFKYWFALSGLSSSIRELKLSPSSDRLFTLVDDERGIRVFDVAALEDQFVALGIDD